MIAQNETPLQPINPAALEPLFQPWEEPRAHRVRNKERGQPAIIAPNRRPSGIAIVQNLRREVQQWREAGYPAASDTTRQLLAHWFERPHRTTTAAGDDFEFRYYFCQREAIESLVYLKEVQKVDYLSSLIDRFGGADRETAALGIEPDEDAWTRYAFKIATGAGKTKCMSLAIVWSYFHALRESDSGMARHFVVIAPNLTVYERLKDDFGDGRIFDSDPLIPAEWRGDWNMSVVLQDEASGAATGGVLYLTNIHRLYDTASKRGKEAEAYGFMGPPVSKTKALDTGAALRDRITSHKRVMLLNDEAHHVWDPDSAWNEAIRFLNDTIKSRSDGGLVAQLDFSATPKDNNGQLFKHIVCDAPLGEAVDGGIVKTPIIGKAEESLGEEPSDNAGFRFDRHLRLGYARWVKSKIEWEKSGKKALLFVMCESTQAADQITERLNTDASFAELNGKTINLHTNLKGKVKKIGQGKNARIEFVPSESEIKDEDLKALRQLSRALDNNTTPYLCIVSVLMLREGWDVKNVTTIVPLRAYSSKAAILPEQTLGRGLRRMTPPGKQGANELVTVVEHPAFASFYESELEQQGVLIESEDVERIPATTISIFPDAARKALKTLEIALPALSQGHRILPKLEKLGIDDVRQAFAKYRPLPLGKGVKADLDYEGKQLLTGEIVERMKIHLPLLASGAGAVSYYVRQIEQICKVPDLHAALAPLLQTFLEEMLFDEKATLYDARLIARLGNSDVAEHIRAVFVPLIRSRTTTTEKRLPSGQPQALSQWKAFQVTHSERRPAIESNLTLFNLVPCNRELEVAFAKYADHAPDAAAFAKNAGPQCLRIDYIGASGQLAFYTPDFFARTRDGRHYLIETKGREDRDVPSKARAAIAWCAAASTPQAPWEYLYIPQTVFERLRTVTLRELADTCRPALQNLIEAETLREDRPLFALLAEADEQKPEIKGLVGAETLAALPERYRKAAEQAATLFRLCENKAGFNFAPVFSALLGSVDDAAKALLVRRLAPDVPCEAARQKAWFDVYLPGNLEGGKRRHYESLAQNLKRTLVHSNGVSLLGLVRNCLDYALNDNLKLGGLFDALKVRFKVAGGRQLLATATRVNDFRNTRVAHQEQELSDAKLAERELVVWIEALRQLTDA
jgi:type III restriction enzyme